MQIQAAQAGDMARIAALYNEAVAFQQAGGHPYWQNLDLSVVERDMALGSQFTLKAGQEIAGIFSLCPPSPLDRDLWQGQAPDEARYINRIIVGDAWRGKKLFAIMLAWCEVELARLGIARLRLDTWADNGALVDYYARFGFVYLGARTSSNSPTLPPQYRSVHLALMEKVMLVGANARPHDPDN